LIPRGPHLEDRGVIIAPHLPDRGGAQRGDRHRAGIVGIVVVDVPGRQQPHPRGQLGRHVQHPLPRCQQLLGQQVTGPAGAFHRPAPAAPGLPPPPPPPPPAPHSHAPAAPPAAPQQRRSPPPCASP